MARLVRPESPRRPAPRAQTKLALPHPHAVAVPVAARRVLAENDPPLRPERLLELDADPSAVRGAVGVVDGACGARPAVSRCHFRC